MSSARDDGLQHCRKRKLSEPGVDLAWHRSIAIVGRVPLAPGQTPEAPAGASRPVDGSSGSIPAGHSADWTVESEHYNKLTGALSQRHFSVLYNGYNLSNSQCLPAGISALSYTHLFPGHRPSQWDRTDLYRILNQANNLYAQYLNVTAGANPQRDSITQRKIKRNGYLLTPREIKDNYLLFDAHFAVGTYLNIIKGVLRDGSASGLEIDLNNLLNGTTAPPAAPSTSTRGALFLSCSYSRLVWKSANGKYYIFDSHFYPPCTESLVIESSSVKFVHDYLFKLVDQTSSGNSRANNNTEYELVPVEINGPISDLTPAQYCEQTPTALDKPRRFLSADDTVPPAELFEAYAAQPETSWPVLAIFDSQEARNGILHYLCLWGGGNYSLGWITEERLQESAAILLNLYKDHSGRFAGALLGNNDGSSLDQRTADIMISLYNEGERFLSRKVKAEKMKLYSMQKNVEEYRNFVIKFKRLLFECDQLLNALKEKDAASKEEKTNWEEGSDDHFGVEDYRRHIKWAYGGYKQN